jgi:hypothetical protein
VARVALAQGSVQRLLVRLETLGQVLVLLHVVKITAPTRLIAPKGAGNQIL